MYGQLYNRVSAPNTPNFLKIELSVTRVLELFPVLDSRGSLRSELYSEAVSTGRRRRYSAGAGARKMRSLILE